MTFLPSTPFRFLAIALALAGCHSSQVVQRPQGPVQLPAARVVPPVSEFKEVEAGPVSKAFPGADAFQAAEFPAPKSPSFPCAQQIHLRLGDVFEVFQGARQVSGQQPELAFYLPSEALSIVELAVVKSDELSFYVLKTRGRGQTLGGLVERAWLDKQGLKPLDAACEARIQTALKNKPYLIIVD